MRKELPLVLVFISGIFMVIQFFVPRSESEFVYEYALDWVIVIGIFALALGIWSLIRVSFEKVRRRSLNWQYAIITLLGLFGMIFFGFGFMGGLESYMFRNFFDHVMIPIQATMFSLLAFFIASAAYRAFRARSLLASVLLGAALVVMLRFNPFLGFLGNPIGDFAEWIITVPNLAAKRAIIMGVGLGIVATALKVILGIERGYMGKD
jgi:hypothetical protein